MASKRPKVFITRPLPAPALAILAEKADLQFGPPTAAVTPQILQQGIHDAVALVSMLTDRIDDQLLAHAPQLRIVANYAAGYNNIDCQAAQSRGIWVTNTPDATTDATADCAWGLMLAVARRIPESESYLRQGKFEGWTPTHFLGLLLSGSTLGIVGMGRIGRAVLRRALGFGMRVIYHSPRPSPDAEAAGAKLVSLNELLQIADVVSLHCPLNDQTRHLIDEAALAKMKSTAILINTARGPIVDEPALAQALQEGRLGGAGIDVYEEEPKVDPQLLAAPRTVLVPHIGSSTLSTRLTMARMALGDVLLVLQGKPPVHPVNHPQPAKG